MDGLYRVKIVTVFYLFMYEGSDKLDTENNYLG